MGLDMPILFDYEQLVGEEPGRHPRRPRSSSSTRRPGRSPTAGAGRRAAPRRRSTPWSPARRSRSTSRRAKGAADRLPGARQGQTRPDLLRQGRRPDPRGQVRRLPPGRRHRPVGADQLRAGQGLLADDPRGDPHRPHAALPADPHVGTVPGRQAPDAGRDQDPGPLDRGRRAARRGRRPAGARSASMAAGVAAGQAGPGARRPGLHDPGLGRGRLPAPGGRQPADRGPLAEGLDHQASTTARACTTS